MNNKPLSWYTNRMGIVIISIFFLYNVFHAAKNNEQLPEWMVLSTVGALAVVVGSPNKAFDVKKNYEKEGQ